jgi:hypothetical protein
MTMDNGRNAFSVRDPALTLTDIFLRKQHTFVEQCRFEHGQNYAIYRNAIYGTKK